MPRNSPLRIDKAGNLVLSEADVVAQCIDWLQLSGWRVLRTGYGEISKGGRVVDRVGETGMPDYQAITYTDYGAACLLVWIEFKAPGGKGVPKGTLRKDQRVWIAAERKRGAIVWVIDSLEQLKKELGKL